MAQYQVGKQMIYETGTSQYQVGVIYVFETASAEFERSESHDLEFSHEMIVSFPVYVESDLEFSDDVDLINTLQPEVEQTVQFTQTLPAPGQTKEHDAESDLEFSHTVDVVNFAQSVESTILFEDACDTTNPTPFVEEVEQTVEFDDEADSSIEDRLVEQTVEFDHTNTKLKVTDGIDRSESHTVEFSDEGQKVFISVDAIPLDAENDVLFTHLATTPIFKAAFNNIVFAQTADQERTKFVESTVEFDQEVTLAVSISREVESDLEFSQHYVYEIGTPELCFYAPIVGSGTFPAAPILVKQSFVTLFYPTVSPTLTVQIRAPEFGDRDRLQHDKINRDTRGGSLKIFADTTWPKLQILEMQFTGLKETEAQAVLDFFEDTLGLEVGFTDWESRTWHGVIVSPDRELVRSKRNNVDISFEFEGELQ